jgi:hypothetical protein
MPLPAMAAEEDVPVSLAQAITIVKQAFNVPGELENFTYSLQVQSKWAKPVWQLDWTAKETGDHIEAMVSAETGVIIAIYQNSDWKPTYPGMPKYGVFPKISAVDALKAAEDFAKVLAGDRFGRTELREMPGPLANLGVELYEHRYNFTFERRENDIPFPENYIQVTVNGENGKVESYYLNWDENLTFPDPASHIDAAKAAETMGSNEIAKLQYWRPYPAGNPDKAEDARLIWQLAGTDYAVDALSGEFYKPEYRWYGLGEFSSVTKDAAAAAPVPFTPAELERITEQGQLISREKAVEIAGQLFGDMAGFTADRQTLQRSGLYPNQLNWNLSFTHADEEAHQYFWRSITIDAKTGEVLAYSKEYKEPAKDDTTELMSWEKARETAEAYLKDHYADRLAAAKLISEPVEDPEDIQTFTYYYERLVNDVPYPTDTLSVSIDRRTGEVLSLNCVWGDIKFAANEGVKPVNGVLNGAFADHPLQLVYSRNYQPEEKPEPATDGLGKDVILPRPEPKDPTQPVRLVWRTYELPTSQYDAKSGKPLAWDGKVMPPQYEAPKDLPGDWAKSFASADAMLAAQIGVWRPGEELMNPGANITRDEFARLLARTCGFSVEDMKPEDLNEFAETYLGTGAGNAPVARMDVAWAIVKYLGLNNAARALNGYAGPFTDLGGVSVEGRGAAALCDGLNLIKGDGKHFSPNANLTAEQALAIIIRTLKAR